MTNAKTYYAVCDANGPISVLLSGDTEEQARADFAELNAREAIDDATTDAEDDLGISGDGMTSGEFDDALREAGAERIGALGDDWDLWGVTDAH